MAKIESLTPEQEALIPIYREKWRNIALSTERIDRPNATPNKRLSHLTLAEGEVTGHKQQISDGTAELYEQDGTLYLQVLSSTATLNHEEHQSTAIPQGTWLIRIQREYEPQGWRYVAD